MSTLSRALRVCSALALSSPALILSQTTNGLVNFGAINVGLTSAPQTLAIAAPADATFTLSYGSEFIVSPSSCSGGTCQVPVAFQPAYAGVRKGAISASSGGSLLSVTPLIGIGTAPQLSLGPSLISTVASPTNALLTSARFFGVAARSTNQLYFSDSVGNRILTMDPRTGQVTVVAGTGVVGAGGDGGPASAAQLNAPSSLSIDPQGNLVVADTGNHKIRRIDLTTGLITTIAGTGAPGFSGDTGLAVNATLNSPAGVVAAFNGYILIADTNNSRIRQIAPDGTIETIAGSGIVGFSGDNGPALAANLNFPTALAIDSNNNVYVADAQNDVIRVFTAGNNIYTFAGTGSTAGYAGDGGAATGATLNLPNGVAVDSANDIYISDGRNNVIRKVTGDNTHIISTVAGSTTAMAGYLGDGGSALAARMSSPAAITIDEVGNVLFVDSGNNALRKLSASAAPVTFAQSSPGTTTTSLITISNTGNLTLSVSNIGLTTNFMVGLGGTCSSTTPALAAGQSCSVELDFTPAIGTPSTGTVTVVSNSLNVSPGGVAVGLAQSNGLYFIPVPPCRVVDTRNAGTFGAPYLNANTSRTLAIRNSPNCAGTIPAGADVQAYALNVTVVPHSTLNFLTVAPSISGVPTYSTLNARDGRTKANAAIVPANLTTSDRTIDVFTTDDTELVLDVFGYYVPQNTAGALAYYPLPPCRIADTRFGNGGIMAAAETRSFPIQNICSVPTSAQAYAFNITAIPQGAIPGNGTILPYVTVWPTGSASQPVVSTLNATTGAVTANAAIIPAGTSGNISIYTAASANMIIDISGYYAPASSSAGGLALYNSTPCRAFDSRFVNSPGGTGTPINGVFSTDVRSPCGLPSVAQSIVLNSTVVPTTSLIYLTLWARGSAEPLQSTLNAYDSAVTSNLAVVPTADGFIASYTAAPSALIYDVFGYFAP